MGGGCPGSRTVYNECRHIMPSGKKCHSPALRNKAYCYYHDALHRAGHASVTGKAEPMPAIEDASGIQIALTQVLNALNSPYMDTRRAGLLLYGLQIAAQLTSRRTDLNSRTDAVRDLSYADDGEVLAPEKVTCEPLEDCLKCGQRETCENFELYEDEVEELESDLEPDEDENEDE